jgi:hypothetical protein
MDNKSLENRVLRRTKMVVGLRISQSEQNANQLLVHTLDISSTGAKIGSLREYIQPGRVLLLQHGRNHAQCRVIWSRRVGPTEIQMGVEFLKSGARFWELDLDEGRAGVWMSLSERCRVSPHVSSVAFGCVFCSPSGDTAASSRRAMSPSCELSRLH